MSLLDQLTDVVMQQALPQASAKAGVNADLASKLMPVVMGALLGGLQKNTADPQGAEALASALDKHDGSLLNNVSHLSDDSVMADGQKILGHILGGKREDTERMLAKTAGVDQNQIGQLMTMAAPALLAMLGQTKRERGLDSAGLAGLVTEESTRAQNKEPSLMGGVMSLFDKDGDGDITDEILEAAGRKLLGGLFGRK